MNHCLSGPESHPVPRGVMHSEKHGPKSSGQSGHRCAGLKAGSEIG